MKTSPLCTKESELGTKVSNRGSDGTKQAPLGLLLQSSPLTGRHFKPSSSRQVWCSIMLVGMSLAFFSLCTGCSKPLGENPVISIDTTMGEIVVELDINSAPETVRNFVEYTNSGHYDGTIFHRVVANSVIQAGGYNRAMEEKLTRPPIRNESTNGLLNKKYTLGMARTADPNSATSQFYINTKDNPEFDRDNARDKFGYCVFGKVIDGKDVVDKIGKVKTKLGGKENDVPFEVIEITKAKVIPKPKSN